MSFGARGSCSRVIAFGLTWLACEACGERHLDAFTRAEPEQLAAGGAAGTSSTPGGATSGGTAGAGGANAGSLNQPTPMAGSGGRALPLGPLLIDDFEDQNTQSAASDGWWFLTSDSTGVQDFGVEPVGDRAGSAFALHTSGVGFTAWGSLLGVDLGGSKGYFDATGYLGIRFWARATATSTRTLTVSLLENNLHYDTTIYLEEEWTEYVFPFASASTPDGAPAFNPATLSALQFFVLTDAPFDFWLDDLVFTNDTLEQ